MCNCAQILRHTNAIDIMPIIYYMGFFGYTFRILPELIIGGVNVMRAIDHKRGMGKSCKTTGSIPKVQ